MVSSTRIKPPQTVATSVRQKAGLTIESLDGAAFGAAIRGLDPGAITDSQKASIWEAYKAARGLLCFSFDRLLERDELHALTAIFGENEYAPGIINGIGKRALQGEEGSDARRTTRRGTRPRRRSVHLLYRQPRSFDPAARSDRPEFSSANGNGTPICPISRSHPPSAYFMRARFLTMAAIPASAAK